ncbi:WRKY transcription factor, partial [Ancistrocladus abbreviatus]
KMQSKKRQPTALQSVEKLIKLLSQQQQQQQQHQSQEIVILDLDCEATADIAVKKFWKVISLLDWTRSCYSPVQTRPD